MIHDQDGSCHVFAVFFIHHARCGRAVGGEMTGKLSGNSRTLFGLVFGVLGFLMGIASLISLIQRWTSVEIANEIARDALSLYRQMTDSFKLVFDDWLFPFLGWSFELPTWSLDLTTIWLLSAAGVSHLHKVSGPPIKRPELDWRIWRFVHFEAYIFFAPYVFLAYAWSFTLGNLFYNLLALGPRADVRKSGRRLHGARKYASAATDVLGTLVFQALPLVSPILVTLIFFLVNAIQLTP